MNEIIVSTVNRTYFIMVVAICIDTELSCIA